VTTWLTVKLGLAKLPEGCGWLHIYGAALLCGIGFTMSLFIGTLAFEHGEFDYGAQVRLGVIEGSILSGILGYVVLRIATREKSGGAAVTGS
jgi:NhaA family Na+:H+ antiporter